MNKSSLIKFSLVCATAVIALGATLPQKVMASETGTVPIVSTPSELALSGTKDNGTVPIVATPSSTDVTANPGCNPYDEAFTVTITVNVPVSSATTLAIEADHPDAVEAPSSVIVPAGSSTVEATFYVKHGDASHHKNVKIQVSANGTTIETKVRVHYVGETD